ncbi:MAG: HAD-IIA family hydrolase [Candidatus Methanoplasma sp.]|jgi:HAD superfamily hydrolase (TIGR01450 family)|nr:HAD-IIA family hydrolase [Candidatus Methanoplasma sp.]
MSSSEIRGFAIDMDGTVYKGGLPIPGAREFISLLKKKGTPFVFLTNNSAKARIRYYEKLVSMGFDVSEDDILTSVTATVRYLNKERRGKKVFLLASPEVEEEVARSGIAVTDLNPDIVLLTYDRTLTFEKLNRAFHFILGGAELVATHPDDLCPTEDSYDIDIGPFIRLFESLANVKANVVGKPNRRMLEMAASVMGLPVENVAMVGDRLYTDMKMAADAGTPSILVLSGEARREDLAGSDVRPTYVVDSVADIPSVIDL